MIDDVYARALARLKAPFISSKPMSVVMAEELAAMKPLLRALLEERLGGSDNLDAGFMAESFAQMLHEAYERLAPEFGYETRCESAKPWVDVPENNRKLMIAACADVLGRFKLRQGLSADAALLKFAGGE